MKRPDYGDATPEDVAQALMRSRNVRLKKPVERQDAPDQTRDDIALNKKGGDKDGTTTLSTP